MTAFFLNRFEQQDHRPEVRLPRWLTFLIVIAIAAMGLGFLAFIPGIWGH